MKDRSAARLRAPLLFVLASAALLILSFPRFTFFGLAWVALVPWLLLLRRTTPRAAFGWSLLIGFLFFLGSMWWLIHVTLLGWLLLCAYQALYLGAFGWAVVRGWGAAAGEQRRLDTTRPWGRAYAFAGIPAVWVSLEYARSHLLSGVGWNLLAYSQAPQPHLIQFADLAGAWGVSFVIVLANVALAEMADAVAWAKGKREADRRAFQRATGHVAWATAALLILTGYGLWRLGRAEAALPVRVAVAQGNIPQEEKWDEAQREPILSRYDALTRAAAQAGPDLIVWPETAVPGYLGLDEPLTRRIAEVAGSAGAPLLVGAPHGRLEGANWKLLNGAALVDAAGVSRWHDKLHLVPYGEFIPFERAFPWLRELLPPIGDFVPGSEYTVFSLGSGFGVRGSGQTHDPQPPALSPQLRFSVLVCFEDLFPELSRRFVQRGARLLLVITNDAWFGPTAAAYQHAQASTLRAVELRVPVVRAANTGWSGCIDAAGRWTGSVRDEQGKELFVAGTHTCEVAPGAAESLYLYWGDWFALLCVGVALIVVWPRRLPYNQASPHVSGARQ